MKKPSLSYKKDLGRCHILRVCVPTALSILNMKMMENAEGGNKRAGIAENNGGRRCERRSRNQ